MSALTDKQARFASMFGQLLHFVDTLPDHRVRVSWGYRSPAANKLIGGHPRSTHISRLAEDVILDKRINGKWVWQKSTAAYKPLGEFWESIGGTWGGRFDDGGHFSLEHNGVK